MKTIIKKSLTIFLINVFLSVHVLNVPALIVREIRQEKESTSDTSTVPTAEAETAYTPSSVSVTTGKEITDFTYALTANGSTPTVSAGQHYRILNTGSGVDATFTFNGVNFNSANVLYVNYDGSVTTTSLAYQVQIRDFTDSVWRNLVPHENNLTNTTESTSGLITQVTASVNNGFQFPVYDGYFSDGSNSPISTPLAHFLNGSSQVQIRFYSTSSTANLELRIDYLSIEPAIDTMRYASGMTIATNGGTVTSGEYNDSTTDDASGLVITAGSSGVDAYFSFTNLPTPYSGANTILVEYSGNKDAALTNYSIYIRDFTNGQWDLLSSTALTNTADASNYFATDPAQFSNYISGNEIRVQVYSTDSSGTATVDYLRVTIGATATNAGFYVGTISRGGSPTGTVANTQTLDTSSASPSNWSIPTSTSDTRTTTEYNGDCGTATNSCVAANIQLPVTVPSNTMVTGVHVAFRYSISSASVDLEFGIRDKRIGNIPLTTAVADETALMMMYRTASYPMQPQIGTDPIATIPIYQPHQMVNTVDNAVNVYARTAATAVATAQTFNWDFAFVSIRYIGPERSISYAWTANGGATLTYGTNSNSNYRYTITDDNGFWTVTADGTNGTDVYLSFTNVSIPTGANKLIITSPLRWSGATTAFTMYLYDFNLGGWRNIVPHASNFTSGTAATEEMIQLEIFNGYFSDGSNNPVDTPLSYFVSGSELRLRLTSTSTTSSLSWDYAMVEFVKDPVYFPAAMAATGTVTAGTEYNDLYTDDTTSNLVVTYNSGLTVDFTFKNVITPPGGANAAYLVFNGWRTTITNFTVSLRNYGGGSCSAGYEAFNSTALTTSTDALNYFIKSISDWSCYISSNQMEVRVTTTGSSGTMTFDFVKLALGTVNTDGAGSSILVGDTFYNTAAKARDLDASLTFNGNSHAWRIRSYPNSQTAKVFDSPSVFVGTIDFPLTIPTNAMPTSLIWMWKGANSGNTGIVPQPQFRESKNYYSDTVNAKLTLTTLAGLPDSTGAAPSADATALNTSTQTVREGWYHLNYNPTTVVTTMFNVPNAIDTESNEVRFRFRTSGSTNFTAAYFDIDAAFVALRYVD